MQFAHELLFLTGANIEREPMPARLGTYVRTVEQVCGIKIDFATKNRHSVTASDIFPRELRVPSTPNYTTLPAEELFLLACRPPALPLQAAKQEGRRLVRVVGVGGTRQ